MTPSSSQVATTSGVRTGRSATAISSRASRRTSWALGGRGGRGGAAEPPCAAGAADQVGDVGVALADRLGLDRPRAEAALVEEGLERPADEQRCKLELRRLVVRVDDRAQGGRDPSRGGGSRGRRTSARLRL